MPAASSTLSSVPAAFSAQPESSASAFGVRVVLPGQNAFVSTAVSGPPGGQASAPGFVFPANAIAVATGAISVESRTQASSEARAFARAEVHNVSLLGGEIRADTVIAQAGARAVPAAAGGQLSDSTVVNLEVLGAPVAVTPNAQVALGDWGYVVTLEQAVVTDDIGRKAYRGFVVALHVHLTKAHAGLPAGTELLVGYAETGVKALSTGR